MAWGFDAYYNKESIFYTISSRPYTLIKLNYMVLQGHLHRVIQGFKTGHRTPDVTKCEIYERPNACKNLVSEDFLTKFAIKHKLERVYLIENVPAENVEDNYLLEKFPHQLIMLDLCAE